MLDYLHNKIIMALCIEYGPIYVGLFKAIPC